MQANPVNFDYSKSALIKSPFEDLKNREVQRKYTRVVVDSRDRDVALFPTPASYEVQLETDIEEVTSVELLLADVPLAAYVVGTNNNQMVVQADGTDYQLELAPGNYDQTALVNSLASALVAAVPARTFTVTYDALTDRAVLKCDAAFALRPAANSSSGLLKVLGMPAAGVASLPDPNTPGSHTLVPPFRINLSDNRYIVMNIQQFSANTSVNSVLHKSFAVLGRNTIVNYHNATSKVIKHLNPPIARLTKLRFTFTDYYGNPYDFQNQDHRIELLFESRKHLLRFT